MHQNPAHSFLEKSPIGKTLVRLKEHYQDKTQLFDVSLKDNLGNSLLHLAIGGRFPVEAIECLLQQGASIHDINCEGENCYGIALRGGFSVEYIRLFIQYDAHFKNSNPSFLAFVKSCILVGRWELIPDFLEGGFSPNFLFDEQQNLAQLLCCYSAPRLSPFYIEKMIAKGLDLSHVDSNGETLLYIAIEQKHPQVVEYLIQKTDCLKTMIHQQNHSGLSLLHLAILEARLERPWIFSLIESLIEHQASFCLKDLNDKTPLDYLDELENLEVKSIIEKLIFQTHIPQTSTEFKKIRI